MANIAGVGGLQVIRCGRIDKSKCMASNIHARQRLLDFRHMTGNAFAPWAIRLVMSVHFKGCRAGAIWRVGTMTIHAYFGGWFAQDGVVTRTVRVMATETSYSVRVHQAGNENSVLPPPMTIGILE